MAIGYRIVRRKNPQNSAETQYIMQHISKGIVDLDQMAAEITKETAFSEADVIGVVTALSSKLQQHLERGNRVDIGPLGRYKIGFSAKPLPDSQATFAPKAERFYINFQPGSRIKRWLKTGLTLQLEK